MRHRGLRRAHRERLKARVRARMRRIWRDGRALADDPRQVARWVTTRQPCSCAMCGNPRRWFGAKTRQERRIEQGESCDGHPH